MSDLTLAPLSRSNEVAKVKSAYNSLIIGPRGLQCENNLLEIMGWESSDVVKFDHGPLLQGQTTAKLKNAYNFRNLQLLCLLLLLLHVCYVRGYTAGLQLSERHK